MSLLGWGSSNSTGKNKKRFQASLKDVNLQSKVIIDNIDEGVILIDHEGTIQLINPGAGKLCGWTPDEATGINVHSVIKLVDEKGQPLNDDLNPFKQVFFSKQSTRGNNIFLADRSNQQVPIALNVSPLLDQYQNVTAAVAVLSNVSKERAEEQKRADFISTASHEMRTPVAAIEGYLALALNDKVSTIDSRARGYLEKAHESTQHLGQLFQDLLSSAKAEDGRLTSHPVVIEMGEYLTKLSEDLRLVAEKKGLSMEFSTGKPSVIDATAEHESQRVVIPLLYVYADPDRLREVITNLFDNAVKYTPEGKITIGISGNDKVVQCYVRDTGPGIPADDIPHLFQKFYRVDNSATRVIGGTGLGLFIARKIIELYSGRIWCESEFGHGSTFYINLPRLSSQQATQMLANGHDANLVKPISTSEAP